jgi:hypothetical protein
MKRYTTRTTIHVSLTSPQEVLLDHVRVDHEVACLVGCEENMSAGMVIAPCYVIASIT